MKYFLIGLVYIYQRSPLKSHSNCRHIPTCSNYMIECLIRYGAFKGSIKGIKRIARCNPFGTSGYDPVIKEKKK